MHALFLLSPPRIPFLPLLPLRSLSFVFCRLDDPWTPCHPSALHRQPYAHASARSSTSQQFAQACDSQNGIVTRHGLACLTFGALNFEMFSFCRPRSSIPS